MTHAASKLGGSYGKMKKTLGDIYQDEEAWAKLSAFIHHVDKGISPEEAFKASQSATFNYAQVTPFIRKMRTSLFGVPFITFPLKATPVALETLAKNPHRISVIGKLKNTINNMSDIEETEAELAAEPSWVKEVFFFKLPWKDSEDRSMYFDLTYIIPFGDIITGQMFAAPTNPQSGLKENPLVTLGSINPTFQVLKELTRNQTFTGKKIFLESDPVEKVGVDILKHLIKTMAPPAVGAQIPSGYNQTDFTESKTGLNASANLPEPVNGEQKSTKRTVGQELSSYLGFKVQPLIADVGEGYQEWNKKKGLETLLMEQGVIKNIYISYQPKVK